MPFSQSHQRLLYWLPRGLTILYVLFISIFALDVFDAGYSAAETLIALFMHLIPSFVLLILLAISWKYPRAGSFLFVLLGIGFTIQFDTYEHPLNFTLISLPVFAIGTLFYLQHVYEKRFLSPSSS